MCLLSSEPCPMKSTLNELNSVDCTRCTVLETHSIRFPFCVRAFSSNFSIAQLGYLAQNAVNQPCGDFEPPFAQSYASTDALLSNPSIYTQTDSRNEDEGGIETWAAASWGCEGNVHTRQGLPRGCVAATGRAISVGLRNSSALNNRAETSPLFWTV